MPTRDSNHARYADSHAATLQMLEKHLPEFEHLLRFDGRFTAADATWEEDDTAQGILRLLTSTHALQVVDKQYDKANRGSYQNVYRWDEKAQKALRQYRNNINRFSDYVDGCDCPTHINKVAENRFECKHCGHEYTRSDMEKIEL